MQEIIDAEDKSKPLSDDQIKENLPKLASRALPGEPSPNTAGFSKSRPHVCEKNTKKKLLTRLNILYTM